MENKFKRFLSLLLALVMVVGMMPMGHVHAEENKAYTTTKIDHGKITGLASSVKDNENNAVAEIPAQRHCCEGIQVVLQGRCQGIQLGNPFGVVGAVALDGCEDHPVEGEQHQNRPQNQQAVGDDLHGHLPLPGCPA